MKLNVTFIVLATVTWSVYLHPLGLQSQSPDPANSPAKLVAIDQIDVGDPLEALDLLPVQNHFDAELICEQELSEFGIMDLMSSVVHEDVRSCGKLVIALEALSDEGPEELTNGLRGALILKGEILPETEAFASQNGSASQQELVPAQTECATCQ
jgi:hypothetical protein